MWERADKMYRIGICDDERETCAHLEAAVYHFFKTRAERCEAEVWYNAESLCRDISSSHFPGLDLLLLDIELPEHNGVTAGQYIREKLNDDQMNIVYISHKTSYALELFKTHPYDFLVKPITDDMLYATLTKLLKLEEVQHKKFIYHNKQAGYSIPYGDILYFSSRNKTIFIYQRNGEKASYNGKLKDILGTLPHQFICIGKSFVINIKYMKSWKYNSVTLTDGTELSIAQSRRADFKKAIFDYAMRNDY
ncbi:MAG: LytTR family DNA-binding domain-containing protein [Lachnospiraceae bacterium]|nr:LytTR family DNA-binding domain-containing protein [Lachnospiraceae bacterium]MCH4108689.1 LytTR family DNA-binding domain-containing protein [Lachnospiraceae bacterium]MCI1402595.1 LytTR family DNA-binding domain-containing protein [Lachnospiraceae bacterium]MCI1431224.1 LytTR family DNA-binding domain-containing protein [Lachnospiraceae bacterium]MCI1556754.1 LytTR family DNA-binding domain-containing protein [Lachnospiraceae bacterium]